LIVLMIDVRKPESLQDNDRKDHFCLPNRPA
jgi:hypothetical protein